MVEQRKKRALILSGGGLKIAFQAGVLKVWLDEAGLDFDLVDGTSGGTLNLAMYCQGMSGTQIANNWRHFQPLAGINFNWQTYPKLFCAESMLKLDKFVDKTFTQWKLDFHQIQASDKEAAFNLYNFSKHQLEVFAPAQLTKDVLKAGIALPMWFPPVQMDGSIYIDPVFITDANLEEAIQRGADELWIIWTVSQKGEWKNGFINNYFQIIETSANGHFKRMLARIQANNKAVAVGNPSEFGRLIEIYLLSAEVPLHYLVNFKQKRFSEAVEAGIDTARRWCQERNIPLSSPDKPVTSDVISQPMKLSFTEKMKGFIVAGSMDYEQAYKVGYKQQTGLMFELTVEILNVDKFVTLDSHETTATGYIQSDILGDKLCLKHGTLNLLVDNQETKRKEMHYRLFFQDATGHPFTLSGFKKVSGKASVDVWRDTTTMYIQIFQGYVVADDEAKAPIVASGILYIHLFDFLKQLTTFHSNGSTPLAQLKAMSTFGKFFLGTLWKTYWKWPSLRGF